MGYRPVQLAGPSYGLSYSYASNSGCKYDENQDALLIGKDIFQGRDIEGQGELFSQPSGLVPFAIADGAEGLPSAHEASARLLRSLFRRDQKSGVQPPTALCEDLRDDLSDLTRKYARLKDAGSTLMTVEWTGDNLRLWHVGDCRAYLYSSNSQQVAQLTTDHTLANQLGVEERELDGAGEFAKSAMEALDNLFIYSPYESSSDDAITCYHQFDKS